MLRDSNIPHVFEPARGKPPAYCAARKHRAGLWREIVVGLVFLCLAACAGSSDGETTGEVVATVAGDTQAAASAAIRVPTNTPGPTRSPEPETASDGNGRRAIEAGTALEATALEDGWTEYGVPAEGFSLEIPPEWRALDIHAETVGDSLGAAGEAYPQLKRFYSPGTLRGLVSAGVKFYALDVSEAAAASGFVTNLNVIAVELDAGRSFDDFVALNLAQIQSFAQSQVTTERLEIDGLDAAVFTYQASVAGLDQQEHALRLFQYLIIRETKAYIITYAVPAEAAGQYRAGVQRSAESFDLME